MLDILRHARPLVAVLRVGDDAAAEDLRLLLGGAVLQLEGIVVAPRVAANVALGKSASGS